MKRSSLQKSARALNYYIPRVQCFFNQFEESSVFQQFQFENNVEIYRFLTSLAHLGPMLQNFFLRNLQKNDK